MAGYSGKPLPQKLGLEYSKRSVVLYPIKNYVELLPGVETCDIQSLGGTYDWLHAFYTHQERLLTDFTTLKQHLTPSGQLWISWPKKSSGVMTDLDENIIREIGLADGLVDVKVAAIDDTWSALKFVFRLRDR